MPIVGRIPPLVNEMGKACSESDCIHWFLEVAWDGHHMMGKQPKMHIGDFENEKNAFLDILKMQIEKFS